MKRMLVMSAALLLLLGVTACGGGEQEAATPAAEESATQVAETHDCDGGCGMTAVPVEKLTEINGKYYCAGCVDKAKEEAGEAAEGHEGHSHG